MYRIGISHILGIILIITGLILILVADISANHNDKNIDNSISESEIIQDTEIITPPEKTDNTDLKALSFAIAGGLCLITAIPCFYMPYSGYALRLFRRKRKNKDDSEQAEKEFDYPDDDFDYIIEEETRKALIELRNQNRKNINKK